MQNHLCLRALARRQTLPHLEPRLLPQHHNLEPLEVIELLSPGHLGLVLRVCAVEEFALDVLAVPLLLESGVADRERELDDDGGEGELGERCGVAWDVLVG